MSKQLKKRKKLGRPASVEPMVHTGVVLPQGLLQRLKADVAASGHGLSGEIRARLQASFDHEKRDAETLRLIECTCELSNSIARDLGVAWYQTEFGRTAMKVGLSVIIQDYAAGAEGPPEGSWSGYPDEASPEIVGQTHARLALRAHPRLPRPAPSRE